MTAKGNFLQKFNEAFAKSNTAFLVANVTDDVEWTIYGDKQIVGIENFKEEVEKMKTSATVTMEIDQMITHGNTAAVNGLMKLTENGKRAVYAFCDVYKLSGFKNPKVKEMKSYVIKIE